MLLKDPPDIIGEKLFVNSTVHISLLLRQWPVADILVDFRSVSGCHQTSIRDLPQTSPPQRCAVSAALSPVASPPPSTTQKQLDSVSMCLLYFTILFCSRIGKNIKAMGPSPQVAKKHCSEKNKLWEGSTAKNPSFFLPVFSFSQGFCIRRHGSCCQWAQHLWQTLRDCWLGETDRPSVWHVWEGNRKIYQTAAGKEWTSEGAAPVSSPYSCV